ncbi:MAG: acyclic terpene utilization AtuA family protein, partial [Burkholderiaceae bacterium]
ADLRLRVAAHTASRAQAEQVTREVLALYTCGPAGGGGVRSQITPRLASDSCWVPRHLISERWSLL